MLSIIESKLKQLDEKINVQSNEIGLADVGVDGYFDHNEAPAMITGVMGGKGSLPDKTDVDTVTHGGLYYLPSERNYINVPFTSPTGNYRMIMMVYRNFESNPRTVDPLIYQRVLTVELSGDIKTSERIYYGKWSKWYYPDGVRLWSGSQNMDGTAIKLTEPYKDYARLRIYWQPYNGDVKSFDILTTLAEMSDFSVNAPNEFGDNPAISVEEVNIKASDDGLSMVPKSLLYYIQDGVTTSPDKSGKGRILQIIGYHKV